MTGSVLAVVPVFGNDTDLHAVTVALQSLEMDVLVVNDGHGAKLSKQLKAAGINHIDLGVNRGVGAATLVGLRASFQHGYLGAVTVDADGAHDPLSVRLLYTEAERHPDQMIVCDRFSTTSLRYVPDSKVAANRFAAAMFAEATGHQFNDVSCGLRYYPASMATPGWTESGFGFIYETLAAISLKESIPIVETWVAYSGRGPWLTQDRELREFIAWALRAGLPSSLRDQVCPVLDATQPPSMLVHALGNESTLHAVPGVRSWLIGGGPRDEVVKRVELPAGISVGIIPDGGRRFARRERIPLEEAYVRSAKRLSSTIKRHRDEVDAWGVYWLSEANLAREPREIEAACAAALLFADDVRIGGLRPVVFGDIARLPDPYRNWAYENNFASSVAERAPLVVIAMAYSPDWEDGYRTGGRPWQLGLAPCVVADIERLDFAIVLRSGGASTLSRFLPRACSWATLHFEERSFNDINLDAWLEKTIADRRRARFGV